MVFARVSQMLKVFSSCLIVAATLSGCAMTSATVSHEQNSLTNSNLVSPPAISARRTPENREFYQCNALENQLRNTVSWFVQEGQSRALVCVKSDDSCWERLAIRFSRDQQAVTAINRLYQGNSCSGVRLAYLSMQYFSLAAEESRACAANGVQDCLSGSLAKRVRYLHRQIHYDLER